MSTPNHRKQRANNSSEHILDTYVDLLIHTGERAATLDAVATAAKVSKGGLLYHFSSKKALLEALAERTVTLAEEDFETMAQAPEGASAYYINSSIPSDTPFDRALIALSRLAQNNNELAQQTLARVQEGWHSLILAELGDERIARAVLLLGDGMYYQRGTRRRLRQPAEGRSHRGRPCGTRTRPAGSQGGGSLNHKSHSIQRLKPQAKTAASHPILQRHRAPGA